MARRWRYPSPRPLASERATGDKDHARRSAPPGGELEHAGNQALQRHHQRRPSQDAVLSRALGDRSSGEPLDAAVAGRMEERLGEPLGDVRLHTDARAGALARGLEAQAFTRGRDVYFAPGRYRPGSAEGRGLLAHELTHVLQQRRAGERASAHRPLLDRPGETAESHAQGAESGGAGARAAAPEAVPQIQRKVDDYGVKNAVTLNESSMGGLHGREGYWEGKIVKDLPITGLHSDYLDGASRGTRREVFSALYRALPKFIAAGVEQQVLSIPVTESDPGAALVFSVWLREQRSPGGTVGKEYFVDLRLIDEKSSSPTDISKQKGRAPQSGDLTLEYPGVDNVDLFKWRYIAQLWRIKRWIGSFSSAELAGEGVTGHLIFKRGKRETRWVVNAYADPATGSLSAEVFLQDEPPTSEKPIADAAEKSLAAKDLEGLTTGSDRLTGITWENEASLEEKDSGELAALLNFNQGARSTELDMIQPVLDVSGTIYHAYFTLIFDTEEQGGVTSTEVRIRFGGRAPAGGSGGPQVTAAALEGRWHVDVFNGSEGAAWLEEGCGHTKLQATGAKSFTGGELATLDMSLGQLGPEAARVEGTRLVRQDFQKTPLGGEHPDKRAAAHIGRVGQHTIVMYDTAFTQDDTRFVGDLSQQNLASSASFAHEVGHALASEQEGLYEAFKKHVTTNKIEPFTWYSQEHETGWKQAGSDPADEEWMGEHFAEAYMLYRMDPEWMEANQLSLYEFFERELDGGKGKSGP